MPSTKNASPISSASPSALKALLLASRPKTWIASLSPVCIGASLAPHLHERLFVLTLLFSLFIQIGTNFANDYFDFVNGADTKLRKGPKRATMEGWISPRSMWIATLSAFSLAFLVAIPLMQIAGLWSLFLAAACVAFGILYTGGPKPLGYIGLGELLVFPFFGPVATCGTYFLQTGTMSWGIFLAGFAPGFLSCAILIANNLRDEKSDRVTGKKTLIVRWGHRFGAWEYTLSLLFSFLIPLILVFGFGFPRQLLFASLVFVIAIPSIKKAFLCHDPSELMPVLPQTAFLLILYTAVFCYFAW